MNLIIGRPGRQAYFATAVAVLSLAFFALTGSETRAQQAHTIPTAETSSNNKTGDREIRVARGWGKLMGAAASKGARAYNRAQRNREEEEESEEEMMSEEPVRESPPARRRSTTPSPAPIKVQKATKRAPDDVYDAWAKKKIEREKAADATPHPLAKDYPDHFVVVCEAGCGGDPARIVYKELRNKRGPVDGSPADPDSPFSMVDEDQTKSVACVGGCYLGPTHLVAVPGDTADHSDPWSSEPEPTQKKTTKPSQTSQRWFQRIEQEAALH